MKKILLYFIMILSAIEVQSQNMIDKAIGVNNLIVGNLYSKDAFFQSLGKPEHVVAPSETDVYDDAYTFCYGKNRFYWIAGEFYGFDLYNSDFAVTGFIRVGDSIAKISLLKGTIEKFESGGVKMISWRPSREGLYQWLSLDIYYDEHDKIESIITFIHDL